MGNIFALVQNQSEGASTMETILMIVGIVGLWKMFEKAGEMGWPAIIPFYNMYKLCEITMGNPFYWVRLFVVIIPVVGWIAAAYFWYQICQAIARAYGKTPGWAWGYFFLTPIFYAITGFDDSSYYGVSGSGDTRTNAAREAKTVDFDVVKNKPEDYRKNVVVEPVQPEPTVQDAQDVQTEEDTVDFTFDEPVE